MKCRVTLLFALMTLVLIRGGAAEPGSPAVRSELVPTGQLRVSIFVLPNVAVKDEAGELHGVAVDLSRELGRELGVPVLVNPALLPLPSIRYETAKQTSPSSSICQTAQPSSTSPRAMSTSRSPTSSQLARIFARWTMSTAPRTGSLHLKMG